MKQHIGHMGQLRGLNLEKARLSINNPEPSVKGLVSANKVDIKKSIPVAQISAYDPVQSQSSQSNHMFKEQKFSVLQSKKMRGTSVRSNFEDRYSNQRK
jgi:hypothetical protein